MKVSAEELKQYLKCPRSYKIQKDGAECKKKSLSLCRSRALHKVIRELHMSGKTLSKFTREEIGGICREHWQDEISSSNVDRDELESIVVQAKKATKTRPKVPAIKKSERMMENLTTWSFEYSRETLSPLFYSEIFYETRIGDIDFTGRIDQIREGENGLEIVIFSTASQEPHMGFLERDFCISLAVHGVWKGNLYGDSKEIHLDTFPSVSVYHFPHIERYQKNNGSYKKGDRKGNPVIRVERTEEAILEFEYEILYAASGIADEFFPMMPMSPCRCNFCLYSHCCPATTSKEEIHEHARTQTTA